MSDFDALYRRLRHLDQQDADLTARSGQHLMDIGKGIDRTAEHFELLKKMAVNKAASGALLDLATNPINIALKECR
jgi:hypothetical protein